MAQFDKEVYEIVKRLQSARLALLSYQPFYALLLMGMKFSLDVTCETAYTDGYRIAFNPDFIKKLSDKELEFVLMHEVLHAALGHPFRHQADYDTECFDKACDIVVNSNIYYSFDKDKSKITLKNFGVAMHKAPDGKEGYLYTVEEVYKMLLAASGKKPKKKKNKQNGKGSNSGDGGGSSPSGNDKNCNKSGDEDDGNLNESDENTLDQTDIDQMDIDEMDIDQTDTDQSANETSTQSESGADDSGEGNNDDADGDDADGGDADGGDANGGKPDNKAKSKNGGARGGTGDLCIGCSSDSKSAASKSKSSKSVSCSADKGEQSIEQKLQDLLASMQAKNAERMARANIKETDELVEETPKTEPHLFDDHSFWEGDDEISTGKNTWLSRMIEATDIIASLDEYDGVFSGSGGMSRGTTPLAAERLIEKIKNPLLDWRTILNDFVQEEINDYSFAPPDKRMEECPFFLPDFNEKDESVKNLLFMIDTSGSMGDDQITQCYSEIYGAIQQFNGKLQGKLGFFDAVVVEPIEFQDEEEFKIIRPKGGGGTSFDIIFEYVKGQIEDNEEPPVSIVILTDGYAPWPPVEATMEIPVLWIINNEVAEPPWGKVARLIEDRKE